MTVTNKTNTVEEAGNGVKTAFTFDFKAQSTSDIKVFKVDQTTLVATLQTVTTDYTVSLNSVTEGGTVTYVVAPTSNENSFIKREMELDQQTDVPTEGNIPEASLNNAYDKSRMIDIQQQEELDRSLKFTETSSLSNITVPEGSGTSDRAGKAIVWNADGDDLTLGDVIGNFLGDWAASTYYEVRDLVKDTSNNNIYYCNTTHTSSGSEPLSTNADSAKWDVIIDAAAAIGPTGARGSDAGFDMTFESAVTDIDQGSGKIWFNNATLSSATVLYMDDENVNAANINAVIDTWDDSNNSGHRGTIIVQDQSDRSIFAVFTVSGTVTSASTYSKIGVTYVGGSGTFSNTNTVTVSFFRTGNSGGGLSDVVSDTTPQLGGELDGQDNVVSKVELKDYAETLVEANTGTSYTIDLTNGNVFELTLTGNVTYTFSNPPANNIGGSFTLMQKQDATGSRTVTWPASVIWAGGTAPTITSTASSIDIFTFLTTDGGTTWYGFTGGQDFS